MLVHSEYIVIHCKYTVKILSLTKLIDRKRLLKHLADPCSITLTVGISLFLLGSLLSVMHWVIKSLMDVAVGMMGTSHFSCTILYQFLSTPVHQCLYSLTSSSTPSSYCSSGWSFCGSGLPATYWYSASVICLSFHTSGFTSSAGKWQLLTATFSTGLQFKKKIYKMINKK